MGKMMAMESKKEGTTMKEDLLEKCKRQTATNKREDQYQKKKEGF